MLGRAGSICVEGNQVAQRSSSLAYRMSPRRSRIEARPSTKIRCSPVHHVHTHPIAALRVYANVPRDPITVLDVNAGGWITFRDRRLTVARWWHHDAPRLAALWRVGALFTRIRDSHFLVAEYTANEAYCSYCDDTPSRCVSQPSADLAEAIRNEGGFLVAPTQRKKAAKVRSRFRRQ
jgi:hypothetical protein